MPASLLKDLKDKRYMDTQSHEWFTVEGLLKSHQYCCLTRRLKPSSLGEDFSMYHPFSEPNALAADSEPATKDSFKALTISVLDKGKLKSNFFNSLRTSEPLLNHPKQDRCFFRSYQS
jgi:hypothetical protein